MSALLYLIRHCESSGPDPDSPLTPRGLEQAEELAARISGLGIQRIVSSPYLRTLQTIMPLAKRLGIQVEPDARLAERKLEWIPERDAWVDLVRRTFLDLDLTIDGSESSQAAQSRGVAAIDQVLSDGGFPTAVVGHGQLLSLVLSHLDGRNTFETWRGLSNPDVLAVSRVEDHFTIERLSF